MSSDSDAPGTLTTPVPDAHLLSLGRLTVQFALLEHRLAHLIQTLLGGDPVRATIATAGLRFQALLSTASSLYRHRVGHDAQRVEKMVTIMNGVSAAGDERNQLIHSTWLGGDLGENPHRMKFGTRLNKGLVSVSVQVPVADIEATVQRLAERAFDVTTLEQDFWGDEEK